MSQHGTTHLLLICFHQGTEQIEHIIFRGGAFANKAFPANIGPILVLRLLGTDFFIASKLTYYDKVCLPNYG